MVIHSNGEHPYSIFDNSELDNPTQVAHITTPYREILGRIQQIDFAAHSFRTTSLTLSNMCYDLLCRVPVPLVEIDTAFLVRSRPGYEINGKVYSTIGDVSYNPIKRNCRLGRFNEDGEQVFYAGVPSRMPKGALSIASILESDKDIINDKIVNGGNRFVTVSRWHLNQRIRVANFTICESAIQNNYTVLETSYHFINSMARKFTPESCESMLSLFNYISEKAAHKGNELFNYRITNAFKRALEKYYGPAINGILYSSAMTENNGLNVVLNKRVIDSNFLKLDGVCVYKIECPPFLKERNVFPCSNFAQPDVYGNYKLRVDPSASILG